ncbi:hypothetical protein EPUS_06746 [Endocarpon pusillum Z07020]|uniref:Uncharacterized protein n=1 Tax=Endocarpon pusillum (strain Z07020 / HMAS-L-300199) TaxID=1263415 RepID=U1GGQ4_ENDPU|nr:uncharacterized protein EPUS_06746 [Endocarpon pusillum Z07020]ERF70961.1 hypothetical protein EPUS_06746 [Endocarpon pusillum Z07020]
MQDVSELGELTPEELFAGLDFGSGIQVSRSKSRSKSAEDETLPESQVISSYESDPKVDATAIANVSSSTVLESDDDQPAFVVTHSYLEDKIENGRPTSIRVAIRPSYQHSPLRESHSAPFRYSAEVLHTMEVGDLLITVDAGNSGKRVAYDPPLNPTPCSSVSSRLRSMSSLRRRIISQGAESIRSNDNSSDRMSMSSVNGGSARSIAMDWDPVVSDIQEGVAV